MPNKAEHLALAEHNQGVIDYLKLEAARHPDWIATVAFYKALHLVEALFTRFTTIKHGGNHVVREETMKKDRRYDNIFPHYKVLKEVSCVARYLASDGSHPRHFSTFTDYLTVDEVLSDILEHRLHQIEESVKRLLSPVKKKTKRRRNQ